MNMSIKKLYKGFMMSFSMFSTIPVPAVWEEQSLSYIIPVFPVVGMVVGAIWYGVAFLLTWAELPILLTAAGVMLLPLFLTGFIHIDGYMDTSDAIFSRGSLEKKRNILKDSHVGAFAVIALAVFMLLMFCGISTVLQETTEWIPFIVIPVLSRCISGLTLLNTKLISNEGFGASFCRNTKMVHSVFLAVLACFCFIGGFFLGGLELVFILAGEVIAGCLSAKYVVKQLDGISGDLCGFILTVTELAAVLIWAVLL